MLIAGAQVVVSSVPVFYERELLGEKPYTVRIATQDEFGAIKYRKPKMIKVVLKGSSPEQSFIRTITDFSKLGELLGFILVGIAWDPAEGRP